MVIIEKDPLLLLLDHKNKTKTFFDLDLSHRCAVNIIVEHIKNVFVLTILLIYYYRKN